MRKRAGSCTPWPFCLSGFGLGVLSGALISSTAAAVLLGLVFLAAGLLLLKR